ncbi:MAG: 2TM domain-containing protein [SAR202 cluster bacterium]|nr:2TM domain-containing protein [SAR202 cluster bacterium]
MERNELARYKETRKAIEKARAMRIFFSHFAAFFIGNIFLGVWNVLTYFIKEDKTLWFYLPLIFWGVGVLIHYLQGVALFENWWERDERIIDERLGGG